MEKRVFIGLAWPYANSSLHLGHVAGLIGGDVLARYHRLKGDYVLMASGTDCYGTPVTLEAAERGVHPSEIAEKFHKEFYDNLVEKLGFSYDIYTKTTNKMHTKVVQQLFLDLYENDYIYTKVEDALYSPFLQSFLPDRFVEGVCPKCNFDGARGDQCDECGELLDPLDLKNPQISSKIFKNRKMSEEDKLLEVRKSKHFYLNLSALQEGLEKNTQEKSSNWRSNAKGIVNTFFKQGLQDRAITRDISWGVEIPVEGYEDKRIYVWFDAVTGYLSASQLWAKEQDKKHEWKQWWENEDALHYYVHGKDNVPFHAIIWAGMLLGQGKFHLPDTIVSSEYLLLDGKQFSKSRGWAVLLPDFLEKFDPETLRFFLIANGPETNDTNFSWDLFRERINSELIGTFGNLVHRVFSIARGRFKGELRFPENIDSDSEEIIDFTKKSFEKVGKLIEETKFRAAFKLIMEVAENGNRYIDKKAPWNKIKEEDKKEEVENDLAVATHVIYALSILINPFLPRASMDIHNFLKEDLENISWSYPQPKKVRKIESISPLYSSITEEEIEEQKAKLNPSEN